MHGQKQDSERWGDLPCDETPRTQVSPYSMQPSPWTRVSGWLSPSRSWKLTSSLCQAVLPGDMRTNSRSLMFITMASCKSLYPHIWRTSLGCLYLFKDSTLRCPWGKGLILQGLLLSRPCTPWVLSSICGWTLLFFPYHPVPPKDQENGHPYYIIITFILKEFLWNY